MLLQWTQAFTSTVPVLILKKEIWDGNPARLNDFPKHERHAAVLVILWTAFGAIFAEEDFFGEGLETLLGGKGRDGVVINGLVED